MPRTRWLLREPAEDAPARLVCFPYSGMGASMYTKWPRRIGATDVVLLQPPGRENRLREPHVATFESFAEQVAEALAPYADRPFSFYGHCAGSLPAFATALRMAESGLPTPDRVYVSSQVAPHQCPCDRYLAMDRAELGAELAALATAMGGNPHPSLIDLALDVLEGDLEASRRYSLPRPVRIPSAITVLRWTQDRETSAADLAGWAAYNDDVRFVDIDGGHYDFMNLPPALLAVLAPDLAEAERRTAVEYQT
ncbi:thioesterase domain-containing protein [Kibdelosporangium lantanae]